MSLFRSAVKGYAFGDIHGHLQELERLLDYLGPNKSDRLVFLGDYIGKGPDSSGVMKKLNDLHEQGFSVTFLLGNWEKLITDAAGVTFREQYLLPSIEAVASLDQQVDLSKATFRGDIIGSSFEISLDVRHPAAFASVLSKLELLHTEPGYIFLHAGLGRHALSANTLHEAIQRQLAQSPSQIIYEERTFNQSPSFPETIVHGHVPIAPPEPHLSGEIKTYSSINPFKNLGRLNLNFSIHCADGALGAMSFPDEKLYTIGKKGFQR